MLTLTLWALLYWQNRGQLNQPNRRGTDPYARWCDRESPRGHTYVDLPDEYIGTGKAMEAGTYWSGLIDDVRIYNRAVRP